MEYHATKYQRAKNPFAENPVPKPFYYPSPTKDIDEHEAICSPGWSRRKPLEEKCVKDNIQLSTSPLPHIQTLNSYGHDLSSVGDSHLDETWPNSERSSSFSVVRDDDDTTLNLDSAVASHPQSNIADIVKNLESLATKYKSAKGGKEVKDKEASESVLKRYIERFRNSDPKPREERLKENEKNKQDFWWLESSPGSAASQNDPADDRRHPNLRRINQKVVPEAQTKQQLTKEALFAVDEETLKLQHKADRLLSQSASSITSGPIVSTAGLGSSTTRSELSSINDEPPFRPLFVKNEVIRRENPSFTSAARAGLDFYSNKHQAPGLPADDILLRWRLSRKLDSSYMHPSTAATVPKNLDPRLEEFRKKLLSQKALVTKEDIYFERQRMAMLLDDEDITKKKAPKTQKDVPTLQSDPILERMNKITNNIDLMKPPIMTTFPVSSDNSQPRHQGHNMNGSNAETKLDHELSSSEQLKNISEGNKNNTASSGVHSQLSVPQMVYVDSSVQVSIDHFGSQVVCDPKEKKYLLHSDYKVSGEGDSKKNSHKISTEVSHTISGVSQHSNKYAQEKMTESGDSIEASSGQVLEQNGLVSRASSNKQSRKSEVNYHQFLEAEKPIDDNIDPDVRIDKSHKRPSYQENVSVSSSSDHEGNERLRNIISGKRLRNTKGKDHDEVISSASSDVSVTSSIKSNSGQRKEVKLRSTNKSDSFEHSKVTKPDKDKERKSDHLTEDLVEKEHSKNLGFKKSKTSKRNKVAESYPSILKPSQSSESIPALHLKHPVNSAIGQTIREQMFEGHSLFSSVDSWASMFPQSPGPVHSLLDSHQTPSPSPRLEQTSEHKQLQSTPIDRPSNDLAGANEGDDYQSDGEFSDDPLLMILREQKNNFLKLLQMVEFKLQET
ncbi:hypothetical protein BgiMline_022050 [Biomphalaria glabrata]|uniref:Uncharacterized protein LOC106059882 n=1 Tax=Biomphalaria glabrata TaxID=6526 RepID=A0A9W3B0Z4_BIOGL|nr:uncharacterized protein LOC106059882 [Biomphalaria glabrata]KAI8756428.1 CAunnamed protein product [Biomphalaria glabrata]